MTDGRDDPAILDISVSNAAIKSMATHTVRCGGFPWLKIVSVSVVSLKKENVVECLGLKPCCSLAAERNSLIVGKMSASRGPTEGACSMAAPAMSTRPKITAILMPSTHPSIWNANHRQKYLRQLSLNGPFIFEAWTIWLQFQMKQSGHLNRSEEIGTGCPVTSQYGKKSPSRMKMWVDNQNNLRLSALRTLAAGHSSEMGL